MTKKLTSSEKLARKICRALFTNANGDRAEMLVGLRKPIFDPVVNLGGWCDGSAIMEVTRIWKMKGGSDAMQRDNRKEAKGKTYGMRERTFRRNLLQPRSQVRCSAHASQWASGSRKWKRETMKAEIQKALVNLLDRRNVHLGDVRVPCDAEILCEEILRLEVIVEDQSELLGMAMDELTRLQSICGDVDSELIQKVIDASNELEASDAKAND